MEVEEKEVDKEVDEKVDHGVQIEKELGASTFSIARQMIKSPICSKLTRWS